MEWNNQKVFALAARRECIWSHPQLNQLLKILRIFFKEKLQRIGTALNDSNNRLTNIESKLNKLEGTVEKFQDELGSVKKKVYGMEKELEGEEKSMKTLEGVIDDIGKCFANLEATMENPNNLHCKNNLKIHGLKEKVEGQDHSRYLIELFHSWLGSESEVVLEIAAAYRVGIYRPTNKYPRDIIVKFPYWNVKAKVLENYWEQPPLTIEGIQERLFPDISGITLDKRRNLRFFTKELEDFGIQYKWGFPFKLIFTYA